MNGCMRLVPTTFVEFIFVFDFEGLITNNVVEIGQPIPALCGTFQISLNLDVYE